MAERATKKKTKAGTKKTASAAKTKKATKEKAKEKEEKTLKDKTLEELILDKPSGKYEVVELIAFWAKQLRQKEEHRHLTQMEVLERAMHEILSGEVSEKEVAKKMASAAPMNGKGKEEAASKPFKK